MDLVLNLFVMWFAGLKLFQTIAAVYPVRDGLFGDSRQAACVTCFVPLVGCWFVSKCRGSFVHVLALLPQMKRLHKGTHSLID